MRALLSLVVASSIAAASPARAAPTPTPEPEPAAAAREVLDLAGAIAAADRNRGPLGRAAARLAAGDPGAAVAACAPLLSSLIDGPSCRLLSAEALLSLDRSGEAAALLAPLVVAPAGDRLGVLAPWGDLLYGEALSASGDPAAALAALDRAAAADPDGPLGKRAEPARVLALARAGRAPEARTAATALGSRISPRVRLLVADALAAAADPSAPDAYRALWRDHPGTPEADRAEARLADLAARGVAVPKVTPAHRLYRADRLLSRGRAHEATRELEAFRALGGATPSQKSRAALLEARAAVGRGERDLAEQLLAPILASRASATVPEALELAARLAARRGEIDAAVAHLDRLAAEHPAHRLAPEAAYLASFFLYDAGRFPEARARFRAFAGKYPKAARADEATWYAAWSTYRDGGYAEAERAFASFLTDFPRSALGPQVRYWRGRALERRGDAAGARAVYRDLARRGDGWYSLLAELRLAPPDPTARPAEPSARDGSPNAASPGDASFVSDTSAPEAETKKASQAPGGTGPALAPSPADVPLRTAGARSRLARAVALYRAGLADAAGDELDAALRGETRPAVLEAVGRIALAAGDAYRAHRLGARLPGDRGDALAYPRAYAADVHRAAGALGVDPHFVWAIMRRESAFRPAVRSHADAIGLLQLLPKTARAICDTAGLDAREAERLGEPAVNVTLGTWYLSRLLERFDGHPALAAAAYNAGPVHVVRWLDDRQGLALDEFVESIPFRETRHYVKRVLGDLAVYRKLAGAPPPSLSFDLPEPRPGVSF